MIGFCFVVCVKLFKIARMADNACRMTLCSRTNNAVESDGNGLCDANPSAAAELEVSGPGATRIPVVDVSNLLPHIPGTLP